jgi:DNA-nicking Smr family endonuclease
MNRRILSDEEKRLWDQVTQNDERLVVRVTDGGLQVPKKKIVVHHNSYSIPVTRSLSSDFRPLTLSHYAGIDRNSADRFRKGERVIEGVMDMHGMTREKAHRALAGFIHSHWELGSRCLLAITGKSGVLCELLPQWLAEPGLRAMILALDVAKPKHGGSGAYYILLRRKRNV